MKGLPLLSIMTWAPFVSAIVIMFFARHRPLLVRLTALIGASISLIASLWVYYAYDRGAAGFQFQEQLALVPSLGINYILAIDGMSALLALLTSIIIFGGVFASWTVKERGQEFYALLLLLVLLSGVVFGGWPAVSARNYPIALIFGPVVIWTAFRFTQRETATGIFILSAIAVWGTLHGFGPFVRETENQSLLALQWWTAVLLR